MYLSCLLVDVGSNPDRPRPGRTWLRNVYRVHQRLRMAFPSQSRVRADPHFLAPFQPHDFQDHTQIPGGSERRLLFRIDPLPGNRAAIIVQSATLPDWEYAFHNADYLLACPPDIRQIAMSAQKGQRLVFRLQVNPTRKVCTKTGPDGVRKNGRRVLAAQAEQWLSTRADFLGISVRLESMVVQRGYVYMHKPGFPPQHLDSIRYDGILEVADPSRFLRAVESGVGPGKAFGFGLLSYRPV